MPRPTNALIVDDEPHVRAFVRLLLREVGIEKTWEAGDGGAALLAIEEHNPDFVMLDINMPVMTGLEVLGLIQEARPELPVMILSSEMALKTVQDAVRMGAIGYLLKHSPKAEAVKMLREALDLLDAETDAPAGE